MHLPLLIILSMLLQDDKGGDQQQRTVKMGMAFFFGAITATMSAGLVLYIFLTQAFGAIKARMVKYYKTV